jgi:hypothetical protein
MSHIFASSRDSATLHVLSLSSLLPSRYCGEAFRWDHILAINKHTTKEEREKFGTDHMEDGDEIVPSHKIIIPQPDRDHSTKVCNETLQDSRVGPNFEF